jgi:hypothetical protein
MTFEETRDNTTDIEASIIAADAHETDPRPFRQPEERHEEHNDGANGYEDDPEDPEHDPLGDAETEYDIEFDAEGVGSVDLAAIRRGMIWMGVFPNQAL